MNMSKKYLQETFIPVYKQSEMYILEQCLEKYILEIPELSLDEVEILMELIDETVESSNKQIRKIITEAKGGGAAEKATNWTIKKAKDLKTQLLPKLGKLWKRAQVVAKKPTVWIGPVLVTGTVAAASILLYHRYLNVAGRACAGTGHGTERTECMKKYKETAKKAAEEYIKKHELNKKV